MTLLSVNVLRNLYLPLAAASLVVCFLFFRVLGPLHLSLIALVGLFLPLLLAAAGGTGSGDLQAATPARKAAPSRLFALARIIHLGGRRSQVGWDSGGGVSEPGQVAASGSRPPFPQRPATRRCATREL